MDALAPTGRLGGRTPATHVPMAGFACLNKVAQPGIHETLDPELTTAAEGCWKLPKRIFRWWLTIGGMFGIFFTDAEA